MVKIHQGCFRNKVISFNGTQLLNLKQYLLRMFQEQGNPSIACGLQNSNLNLIWKRNFQPKFSEQSKRELKCEKQKRICFLK